MNHLSLDSRVGIDFVSTPCECVTCQHKMQVVLETTIVILDGKLLNFKLPRQGEFNCSNCNSTYVRWERTKIIQ